MFVTIARGAGARRSRARAALDRGDASASSACSCSCIRAPTVSAWRTLIALLAAVLSASVAIQHQVPVAHRKAGRASCSTRRCYGCRCRWCRRCSSGRRPQRHHLAVGRAVPACSAPAAHMCWTRALQLGDASMLTPISFMQVPVVGVFGYWLFDEPVDRWTVIGAVDHLRLQRLHRASRNASGQADHHRPADPVGNPAALMRPWPVFGYT